VASFQKPGGRLTGIHSQVTDVTAKRLGLLKEMIPTLHRVAIFYNPGNPNTQQAVTMTRAAALQLHVQIVERPVGSVDELRASLRRFRPGEAEAFFHVTDGMLISQTDMIVDFARKNKLPTMLSDEASVAKGALASYGVSYYLTGQLASKLVQRVLLGADPAGLPVEQVDQLHLVINLKTAKALGLTIPPSVLQRADRVIE
jgi:putative ABC transport system substrate-binding protein